MWYQFKCRSCNKFIYTDNLSEENTLYNCENCEAGNWINSDFDGLIEIDKDEFENKTIDSNESLTEVNNTLTDKYVVLELYKGLAFLLMIAATGFFIYSLVQFFDAPKAARKILENAIIISTVSYFITMFSLFCLTKIIDFLFDLDKQDKILAPDKISSEEE